MDEGESECVELMDKDNDKVVDTDLTDVCDLVRGDFVKDIDFDAVEDNEAQSLDTVSVGCNEYVGALGVMV